MKRMEHIKVFEEFTDKPVNEASMSLTKYYKDYDKEIKNVAKEIDDIINSATFVNPMAKDKLLDLITDLVEEYYFNKS